MVARAVCRSGDMPPKCIPYSNHSHFSSTKWLKDWLSRNGSFLCQTYLKQSWWEIHLLLSARGSQSSGRKNNASFLICHMVNRNMNLIKYNNPMFAGRRRKIHKQMSRDVIDQHFAHNHTSFSESVGYPCRTTLRLPDSYDAKIAKICNLWIFLPINHFFKTVTCMSALWHFIECTGKGLVQVLSMYQVFLKPLQMAPEGATKIRN